MGDYSKTASHTLSPWIHKTGPAEANVHEIRNPVALFKVMLFSSLTGQVRLYSVGFLLSETVRKLLFFAKNMKKMVNLPLFLEIENVTVFLVHISFFFKNQLIFFKEIKFEMHFVFHAPSGS